MKRTPANKEASSTGKPARPFSASKMIPKDQPITKKGAIPKPGAASTAAKAKEREELKVEESDDPVQIEVNKVREQHQREKQKLGAQVRELQASAQELETQVRELTGRNHELEVKLKEDKMEFKRLRSQISSLEIEKKQLQDEVREKAQIIEKSLEAMGENFNQRRDFVLSAQLIKQRRYIQHLTKMQKSYRSVEAELEFQINQLLGYLKEDVLDSEESWNSKSKLTFAKAQGVHGTLTHLRTKFRDLMAQTSFQFTQNLLKEYDLKSGKSLSKKQVHLQLESAANRILRRLEAKSGDVQVLSDLRDFVEVSLRYGLDVRLEDDEYEGVLSNAQLFNNALLSFEQKAARAEDFERRLNENQALLEQADVVQYDRLCLLQKYRQSSFLDCYVARLENDSSLLSTPHSKGGAASGSARKQFTDFVQKMQNLVAFDVQVLSKQNSVLAAMLLQTQKQLRDLNRYVRSQFQSLEQTIRQQLFEPFNDMFEVYQKFFCADKNANYPIHLANTFNLHCEQMHKELVALVRLSENQVFDYVEEQRAPVIHQMVLAYDEFFRTQAPLQ